MRNQILLHLFAVRQDIFPKLLNDSLKVCGNGYFITPLLYTRVAKYILTNEPREVYVHCAAYVLQDIVLS